MILPFLAAATGGHIRFEDLALYDVESGVKLFEVGEPVTVGVIDAEPGARGRVDGVDDRRDRDDLAGHLLEDDQCRARSERVVDADGLALGTRADEVLVAVLVPRALLDAGFAMFDGV